MDEYRRLQQERWRRSQMQNQNNPARQNPQQIVNRPPPQNQEPIIQPPPQLRAYTRSPVQNPNNNNRQRMSTPQREEISRKDEEYAKKLAEQFQLEERQQELEREELAKRDEELARQLQQEMYEQRSPHRGGNDSYMEDDSGDEDEDEDEDEEGPDNHPQRVDRLIESPNRMNNPFGSLQGFFPNGFGNGFQQPQNGTIRTSGGSTSTVTTIRTGPDGRQHIQTQVTSSNNTPNRQQQQQQQQQQPNNLFNVVRPNVVGNNSPNPQQQGNQRRRQPVNNPNNFFGEDFMNPRRPFIPPMARFDDFFSSFGGGGGRGGNDMMQQMLNQMGMFRGGFPGGGGGFGGNGNMSYEDMIRLSEQVGNVNRGTSKETINDNSLEFEIKDKSKDVPKDCKNCTICYEDFENGDKVRRLNCMHMFHAKCIDRWLENYNAICPICREPIKVSQQIRNNEERNQEQERRNNQRQGGGGGGQQQQQPQGRGSGGGGNMFL